jgi:DNA-binding IclR family transcriptional regulator
VIETSAKLKKQILLHLADQPLSLKEVAEKMDLKEKKAFRLLRSLFQKGEIEVFRDIDKIRRYQHVKEKTKPI